MNPAESIVEEVMRMAIVFACIAPHGAGIIPELAGDSLEAFVPTRKSMKTLANWMQKQQAETIIIASPHNVRLEAAIGVVTTEFTEGTLKANSKQIRLRCTCDRQLAKEVLRNAKRLMLPVVGINYGTNEGPASCMPMDWGTFIPLWFFAGKDQDKLKVIVVTPSREIPLHHLVDFGQAIAEAAEVSGRRTAFVASADQGHAHMANGPYGFHSASAEFDEMVKHAVSENDIKPLLNLPPQFV
jgi:aromatic ring-opening dioxygenase LigB subunit